MSQSFGRLPPEVLRRRYVQLHKTLQEALKASTTLQIRNEILEAENRALHERLDVIETEYLGREYSSSALTQIKGAQNV